MRLRIFRLKYFTYNIAESQPLSILLETSKWIRYINFRGKYILVCCYNGQYIFLTKLEYNVIPLSGHAVGNSLDLNKPLKNK